MLRKISLYLLSIASFAFIGCSLEKDATIVADVILDGKDSTVWELNELTINGGPNIAVQQNDCIRDNRLIFRENLTYRIINGELACDTSEAYILEEGLWDVSEHQERIFFFPTDSTEARNGFVEDAAETRIVYEITKGDTVYEYTYLLEGILSSF